jgi:CBS domain-containing protein
MDDQSEFDEAYADDPEARVVDERRLGQAILGAAIEELEPQPPVSVPAGASVRDAVELMQRHGIGAVLVLDDRGRVEGIFTERDVLRRVALARTELTRPVADLMTPSPECLGLQDGVAFALNRMIVGGFRHVPIVDDAGAPVAVLSLREVVSFIVSLLPARVLNLPPEPGLEARSPDGG